MNITPIDPTNSDFLPPGDGVYSYRGYWIVVEGPSFSIFHPRSIAAQSKVDSPLEYGMGFIDEILDNILSR